MGERKISTNGRLYVIKAEDFDPKKHEVKTLPAGQHLFVRDIQLPENLELKIRQLEAYQIRMYVIVNPKCERVLGPFKTRGEAEQFWEGWDWEEGDFIASVDQSINFAEDWFYEQTELVLREDES